MSKLTLRNIYKVYEGGVRAVNDFNLEIEDKEFVVFVGPSGCGKSTTLRMIAGLEEITSGELFIDDSLVNDVEPKDRNIAMVFQNYALYPHMSVFQNMAFGLKLRKVPAEEVEKRVKYAAEILGINDLLTRKPKALSGGQRQRVALGRAIVREPNVFLLDEPLSNLDAKLRVQMRTEITKLHQRLQTTFIYVTHDQTEAMTMGDRIVVMKDGLIQQVDTPATLYEEPCNVFVATFLGSPQMNIFNATLVKNETLAVAFGNEVVSFDEIKSKQIVNESYVGQEVLFGIRPENIVLSDSGISATIDQLEHLGSETIVYAKVKGIKEYIVAKIPSNHNINRGDDIFLSFDMPKAHLFDKDNKQSIMGVPEFNAIDITLKDKNTMVYSDNTETTLPLEVTESFLDYSIESCASIKIKTDKVSIHETPDSLVLPGVVDFKVVGSDSDVLYVKSHLADHYLIFRVKHCSIQSGDEVQLYAPFKYVHFIDKDGNKLNCKEKVHDNLAECDVKTIEGKTTITLKGKKLVFDDLHVEDGKYKFKLLSNKVGFKYNKAYAKKNKIENNVISINTLKASAYDEEKIGNKNVVYVQIEGFTNYVTIALEDAFTVYKMPEFEIVINADSFELIK